jgi:hypothetical protein
MNRIGKRKHITMDSLNAWLRGETQKEGNKA